MKTGKFFDRINRVFEKIPDKLRNHRFLYWIIFILLSFIVIAGVTKVKVDMRLEVFFPKDDPMKKAYDDFRKHFGSDEVIYIVCETKDGDIFSHASLQALSGIQNRLLLEKEGKKSPLNHITRVNSILNAKLLELEDGTLRLNPFIVSDLPKTAEEREHLRRKAVKHEKYASIYFSKDYKYGGIIIGTDFKAHYDESEGKFTEPTPTEYADFARALENVLQKKEFQDAFTFYPVGEPIIAAFLRDKLGPQVAIINLLAFLLIIASLWFLFRSFCSVVWPLLIIFLTLFWVVGIIGWTGTAMDPMIGFIFFLILAVGIGDAIHILSGYLFLRQQNQSHEQAMRSVYKKSGLACLLTSVTTAVALLSLIVVPITPIRSFGIFAALGVMIAFGFTIFLLPLLLEIWKPVSKKKSKKIAATPYKPHIIQRLIQKIETVGINYPIRVIAVFLILAIICIPGVLKIKVDSDRLIFAKEDSPIQKAYEKVDQLMGGTQSMEIILDTGQVQGVKNINLIMAMADLQRYLEKQYPHLVNNSFSFIDMFIEIYRTFAGDEGKSVGQEKDREIFSKILASLSLVDQAKLKGFVSGDFSKTRISIRLKNARASEYLKMLKETRVQIKKYVDPLKKIYPGIQVNITGGFALMMEMADGISKAQYSSFGLVFLVICILFLVIFGSLKLGIIGLIPNIYPILVIFGIMGHFDILLDAVTVIIAPLVLGIVVDDTIHFLAHFRMELSIHGNIKDAVLHAIREVGQAITFTTIILASGFSFFMLSVHLSISRIGLLSAIAFVVALLADLFLLPALCAVFKVKPGK
jgi:hydrophobe/amphiphile efflux-3 (HAE3) family protein